MYVKSVAFAAALAMLASPVFAATMAPDAQNHFKAIASGNVTMIMSQYAPNATLHWIGGPLDGSYAGTKAIQSAWTKFSGANSKLTEKVDDIMVATNPDGMTVTANVDFKGSSSIPVRYVLTYRKGKIVDEIWQIDPNMNMQ